MNASPGRTCSTGVLRSTASTPSTAVETWNVTKPEKAICCTFASRMQVLKSLASVTTGEPEVRMRVIAISLATLRIDLPWTSMSMTSYSAAVGAVLMLESSGSHGQGEVARRVAGAGRAVGDVDRRVADVDDAGPGDGHAGHQRALGVDRYGRGPALGRQEHVAGADGLRRAAAVVAFGELAARGLLAPVHGPDGEVHHHD